MNAVTESSLLNTRTYGSLSYSKEKEAWIIDKIEPHVSLRLKALFPRISQTQVGRFTFKAQPDTCADLFWFTQRYPMLMTVSDEGLLQKQSSAFHQEVAERHRITMPEYLPPQYGELKPDCELRNYQMQFVELFRRTRSLLLGDDTGLGKTYEAIGAFLLPGALPVATVVQTNAADQWEEKIQEFSYLRTHIIKGTKPYDLPQADVYIFRYSQLAGWVEVFATNFFKMCCFDEIQELRHGDDTSKGRGAKILTTHTEMQLAMSATPIFNFGIEIFNIIDNYVRPGALGNRAEFIREWCADDGKIVEDPKALGTYLTENHILLRRLKKHPPVNRVIIEVPYDKNEVDKIENLARDLALRTLHGSFHESGQAAREFDIWMRQVTGVAKAKAVAAYARIYAEQGTPIILAGWHREVYEIWLQELKDLNPLMYTGSESIAQKRKTKAAFIAGESKIFILSLRSGSGIDGLQKICSTVLFGEIDWSPQVHEQVIGRVDRDGSFLGNLEEMEENPVQAVFLLTQYGSDPVITDLLGLKDSQACGIMNPNQGPVKKNHDTARIKEMAKRYLESLNKSEKHELILQQ